MAIIASAAPPRDPAELPPPGATIAVCTLVVDVGIQAGGKFEPRQQIYLGWELPDLPPRKWKDKDGVEHQGPKTIGGFYTLSLDPKAKLRGLLESWRGQGFTEEEVKAFDVAAVLGKTCMLNILHNTGANGQTYANVDVVIKAPAGQARKAKGDLIEYSANTPNSQVLEKLPKFLRDKIANRIVRQPATAATAPATEPESLEEEIPF